jgi:hypothetical protein
MSNMKPIVLASFLEGGGEMAWAWWHEQHSRLALIGDKKQSPTKQIIQSVAKLIHERDPKSVYWITDEEKSSLSEVVGMDSISWVEAFSDPPVEYEDRKIFIENRKFFSTSFFRLLAGTKGIHRKDLMPPSSYKAHVEGPMAGYIRTIDQMQDGEHKQWLQSEVKALSNVYWYQTRQEGTKYYLKTDGNEYDRALSFLTAAWSFWTYTCQVDDPKQLLLIIEAPKEFLVPNADPLVQEIIAEALRILSFLSITTTTTVILASETFYPIPEQNYRFRVFFETRDSDIDLTLPENKEVIQLPSLFEAWENGLSKVAMWEDNYTGERFATEFKDEMRMMDEFGQQEQGTN